jgi:tetratricopeptide (TPR) repeat protein
MGDSAAALRHFDRALALREPLARADASNVNNQLALARTYKILGDFHSSLAKKRQHAASWQEARSWYQRGHGILEPLDARGVLQGEERKTLVEINMALKRCDAALENVPGQ